MEPSRIENLIVKYLVNEASADELDFLSLWISNPNNERVFDKHVKIHYEVTAAVSKPDIDSIKKNLLLKIKKDKNPFRNPKFTDPLKYAAIFVLLFGLGYFFQEAQSDDAVEVVDKSGIALKNDVVTLKTAEGDLIILDENETKLVKDSDGTVIGKQDKNSITYTLKNPVDKEVYNTLNVPYGKRFDIILSDGSHIFLNSGSSLKYATTFPKGQPRNVFLTGEAYFDVAKNESNPFVVHADALNVVVLGTQFNVSHYPENEEINTVLVEGSVALSNDNGFETQQTVLQPGYKAAWNKTNKNTGVENVDTRIHTAWLDGKLMFRNATFKQIRHQLQRHYNVTIKNTNVVLDEQRFDATFDIETIEQILETFDKSFAIDYEIVDNTIFIQ